MSDSKIQTMIQFPDTDELRHEVHWVQPQFEAVDGFEEKNIWDPAGLVVCLGFMDDNGSSIIGSGVMVAPGLCLTATHVIEETLVKHGFINSVVDKNIMRLWRNVAFDAFIGDVEVVPFGEPRIKRSDVSLLSCAPISDHNDNHPILMSHVEVAVPKIGERLWTVGYRQVANNGTPRIAVFISSGLVVDQHLEGRGSYITGPCVEVAMKALGGMSGGPVFNSKGNVVGIVSSCLEGQDDDRGPTFVSLIWTSLVAEIFTPWPSEYWPNQIGGLQIGKKLNSAKVHGSAEKKEGGVITLKLLEQDREEMTALLISEISDLYDDEDQDLESLAYEAFTLFLEREGLYSLSSIETKMFRKSLVESDSAEIIKLCECIDADCLEGIEDLDIKSIQKLESGLLSIDATFNLRGVTVVLEMSKQEYQSQKSRINSKPSFYDIDVMQDRVLLSHYARPYFRVGFSYDQEADYCDDFSVFVLRTDV
ncbi:MAG: serine protease [Proteobacteria bacterium]|nr:serine protease [Pseudomonadota bacterium]